MKNDRLKKIFLDEALALCDSKNDDYANPDDYYANFRMCEAGGIETFRGVYVRLLDKISRLNEFMRKYKMNGSISSNHERIEDTLLDAINYSAIMLDTYRQWREGNESTGLCANGNKGKCRKARKSDGYDKGQAGPTVEGYNGEELKDNDGEFLITNTAPSLEDIQEKERAES